MKLLVVNADDCGLSPGVTRAIVACHREGLVTSTSIMANLPSFADAVAAVAPCEHLGLGVHLNLTSGPPVSAATARSRLVDARGHFHSLAGLVARVTCGRIGEAEIEAEMAAQIARLRDAGLALTHLDSHQNVHLHPRIRRAVYRLAARFRIPWVRFHRQRPVGPPPGVATGRAAWRNALAVGVARAFVAGGGRGGFWRDAGPERRILGAPMVVVPSQDRWLAGVAATIGEGLTELACHPGWADDELRRWDGYAEGREAEVTALRDPAQRRRLEARGIRLVHYGEIDGAGRAADA